MARIDRLKGELGEGRSDMIRANSHRIPKRERESTRDDLSVKRERKKQNRATDELREEVEMLEIMLSSLVDVLEENRIVGHKEWENRIKKRLSSK